MSWLRELGEVVGTLPSLQKKLLLALAFGVLGMFAVPFLEIRQLSLLRGSDSTGYYLWLRSAMVDGDWDFQNDLKTCNTLTEDFRSALLNSPRTETGRCPNKYGIGWAVVSAPFYLVADGVVVAGRAVGWWDLERDGYNVVYQIVIQIGHFLLGLAGLLLAWRCVRLWCGDPASALWGVLLVLAASPQLYYFTIKLSMSHNSAFFAIALLTWACLDILRGSGRMWPWFLAGVGWGLAVTLRFQLAVFGLLPACVWMMRWSAGEQAGRMARATIFWLMGALPWLGLQFYAWRVVYGHWLIFTYGAEGEVFNWLHPELGNILFSSFHGLFYWHPFLLMGAVGYFWLALKGRGLHWAGLGSIIGILYVNASWWCWWFAGSFGSRAFESVLIFFMAGTAFLLVRSTPIWRKLIWSIGVFAVLWNFYIMALYYTGMIERSAPVTWTTMLQAGLRSAGGMGLP